MKMHERLRIARERRGFGSASEAAEALGIPYGTYSGHENGSRGITRKNVARYAAFFGVSPAWLEHGVEDAAEKASQEKLAALKERSLKDHIAELRGDVVRLEQAVAVVEGAMLSAGLKPEYLGELRRLIQECLEEPLDPAIPEAEFASRRDMTKFALGQFLKQHGALSDEE